MPTRPVAYTAVLADLLRSYSGEMAALDDLARGWLAHVNPAVVPLLAYSPEETLLAGLDHSLGIPPWT